MKWFLRHLSGFIPVLGLEELRVKSMRLVWFTCAPTQAMLAILNFHLNKGSFFFVGVRVIEVGPLVYIRHSLP